MTSVKLTKAQDELLRKLAGDTEITRHRTERPTGGRNGGIKVTYQYRCGGQAVNAKTFAALDDAGYIKQTYHPLSIFQAARFGISAAGKTRAAGEEA